MDIIQELGVENLKVVSYYTEDKKTKKRKLAFKLTTDNPVQKYPELFILNKFFLQMQKQEAENIKIEIFKINEQLDLDPNEEVEISFFEQPLKSLFLDYIGQKEIESKIRAEINLHKNSPKVFVIKENKSPFGVQITEKNAMDNITLMLYISKKSDLLLKKELFSQVHTAILKSGIDSVQDVTTIYVTKLEDNMLDVLSISAYGKEIIKAGNGILYILPRNMKLRGIYEIINI